MSRSAALALALPLALAFVNGAIAQEQAMAADESMEGPMKLRDFPPIAIDANGTTYSSETFEGDWVEFTFAAPLDPLNVVVHLTAPGGGFVDVYCANGMSIFQWQRVLPARGYYIWKSDHRAGNDTIFISRYDRNYVYGEDRQYNCIVYGTAHSSRTVDSVPFTIEAYYDDDNRHITAEDRGAVLKLFERCCTREFGSCLQWAMALRQDPGRFSDFCHIPPSRCNEEGSLVELDMSGFDLRCDAFPVEELSKISTLEKLHLSQNPGLMNGSDPDSLGSVVALMDALPRLTHFDAAAAGITGSLSAASTAPTLCAAAGKMVSINLSTNSISGSIPQCLMQSPSLQDLSLGQNKLTGELPVPLPDSPLENLILAFNEISGSIPPGFFAAGVHIKVIDLRSNLLAGTIPLDIGSAPSGLTRLNLSNNTLSGAVPDSLATDAINLDFLDVSGNELDALPSAPWESETLYVFAASENRIEGSFPDLSKSEDLTFLMLYDNFLSGFLPAVEDGSYQALRIMNISNNAFSGEISAGWIEGTSIFRGDLTDQLRHVLDLSFNNFTGTDVAFATAAAQSADAGELVLSGNPLCSTGDDIFGTENALFACDPLCDAPEGGVGGAAPDCVDSGAAMLFFKDIGSATQASDVGGGSLLDKANG